MFTRTNLPVSGSRLSIQRSFPTSMARSCLISTFMRIRRRGRSDEDLVMHGSGFDRMIGWRRSALTGKDARRLVVRPADSEVTALIGRRIGRRGEERAVELAGAVTAIKSAIEILRSGRGGRSVARIRPV